MVATRFPYGAHSFLTSAGYAVDGSNGKLYPLTVAPIATYVEFTGASDLQATCRPSHEKSPGGGGCAGAHSLTQ